MTRKDLKKEEFNPYYGNYINKLDINLDLRTGFTIGKEKVCNFFKAIPNEKLDFKYTSDKWTIKEVFQHIIDTERIFIYRLFRIARGDKTSLTGFDQNIYVKPSRANEKTIDDLLNEFTATRDYSISLINSLSNEDLKTVGFSNEDKMSARAAAFTIIGHEIWHIEVIKDKYL
jgi:uncharacterized damage-inducible protein DinB